MKKKLKHKRSVIVTPKPTPQPVSVIAEKGDIGWCSKVTATKLTTPCNVISIGFNWDSTPLFAIEHKRVLRLIVSPLDPGQTLEPKVAKSVFEFVKECDGESIVVHCGEGRVRSPAIALAICNMDREYLPDPQKMFGHGLGDGGMCMDLYRQLSRALVALDDAEVKSE